jgi:hypothetical protein
MGTSTEKPEKTHLSVESSLRRLEQRHHNLLADLLNVGLVLRGSIAQRRTRCGKPSCRCHADPSRRHGPYFIWTRKVAGKTVTVQLRPEHAAHCKNWNQNMRKLDRIVRELQTIGLKAATLVRSH